MGQGENHSLRVEDKDDMHVVRNLPRRRQIDHSNLDIK